MIRERILLRLFFSLLLLLSFSPFCTYEPTFQIPPRGRKAPVSLQTDSKQIRKGEPYHVKSSCNRLSLDVETGSALFI